jgi:hypothetical protein
MVKIHGMAGFLITAEAMVTEEPLKKNGNTPDAGDMDY